MKNAYIFVHDPMITMVYDKDETIDMFGEDFLIESGYSIPNELIERYKANKAEFQKIQKELDLIKETQNKDRY